MKRDGSAYVVRYTKRRFRSPSAVFAPYVVKRPNGGCQVLFPLSELDRLVQTAIAVSEGRTMGEWVARPPARKRGGK